MLLNVLKTIFYKNKMLFVIAVIVAIVLIAGCSAQGGGGYSAPSGPVGGGC
jgi:uncharacterized lipoprotein YajG